MINRVEKLQYNINSEDTKISALSSSRIDKYEYLEDKEILSSAQRRVIERAKFLYSRLGKALDKQIKTIEDQGKKSRGYKSFKTNRKLTKTKIK